MAAPTIIAAEAPWQPRSFGSLYEEVLRERGLTCADYSGTDSTFTSASAQQIVEAKGCVLEGLAFLMDRFRETWPLSEDDATAVTDFSRVLLPLDWGDWGKGGAWWKGVKLTPLTPEEYGANVRPDSDGGGVMCAEVSGDPSHARVVMVTNTETSIVYYRQALDVFPRQAAAWTAHLLYVATPKNVTVDTNVLRVPVKLQPILMDYTRAAWRRRRGDAKGACDFLDLVETQIVTVFEGLGDQMPMRVVSSLPHENATRR